MTICLFAWSCNKADTNDGELAGWETELIENAAQAEDMANFLENAHIGVVQGGVYYYERLDGAKGGYIVNGHAGGLGYKATEFLIDNDGTARAYTSVEFVGNYTKDYNWRVSSDDPMILIFTDAEGNECISKLACYKGDLEYCGHRGWYIFEGFPGYYNPDTNQHYKHYMLMLYVDTDPERRAEVEALFEKAKAENK